jgi:hypothetical protein
MLRITTVAAALMLSSAAHAFDCAKLDKAEVSQAKINECNYRQSDSYWRNHGTRCLARSIRPTRPVGPGEVDPNEPRHNMIIFATSFDKGTYCEHGGMCYPAKDFRFITPCTKKEIAE